jgi:acyl-CoA dehydrogenase
MILAGHAMGDYKPAMPAIEDLPMHREEGAAQSGKTAWRCKQCGHIHYGDEPPEACPYCFFPAGAFKELAG